MGTGEDERPWYRIISEKAHKEKLWEVNITLTPGIWHCVDASYERKAQKGVTKTNTIEGAENEFHFSL